jgi:hypothetical protein
MSLFTIKEKLKKLFSRDRIQIINKEDSITGVEDKIFEEIEKDLNKQNIYFMR